LWFKLTGVTVSGGLIGNSGTNPDWSARAQSGSYLKFNVNFGDGNNEIQSNTSLTSDVWYHAVFQLDRDGYEMMYLNNVLQTNKIDISSYSATDLSNSNTFMIGNNGNGVNYYHNGLIDEVSVYNRLITIEEISELYSLGVGKFWPYGGAGGDSLTMQITEWDPRIDTARILWKYSGAGFSSSRTDGNLFAALNATDTTLFHDTTFLWSGLKDTSVNWTIWHGLTDVWTAIPNKFTVFIDSSNVIPVRPDPGGYWDTIFYIDFEEHSVPIEYTNNSGTSPLPDLFSPDWNGTTWRDSDHRWPGWWSGKFRDSIVVDPLLGSKSMKFSFKDTIVDGYDGQLSSRGGDKWITPLGGEYQEIYLSYNIMYRSGYDFGKGKLPGVNIGTERDHGEENYTVTGSSTMMNFHPDVDTYHGWYHTGTTGTITWYTYLPSGRYPALKTWDEFQPSGTNLSYSSVVPGAFIWDASDLKWYNITVRYVTNTFTGGVANSDGLMEGYINGKLIERWSGLKFMPNSDDGKGINSIYFANFFGGGSTVENDEWTLFDDIIVFTYDVLVDVPRGNVLSPPGRVLNLPNYPKAVQE